MSINQDVVQDVLSAFQRSPFFKGMATNRSIPASFSITGYPVTQEEAGFNLYNYHQTSSDCNLTWYFAFNQLCYPLADMD